MIPYITKYVSLRDVDVNILKCIYKIIMGLNAGKPGILHANNKGADQPVHPRSLISAFVICLLESKISKLASRKILIFHLVSASEQVRLSLT